MAKDIEWAQKVFARMIADADEDIWTGRLTMLCAEEGVSTSYYSQVVKTLKGVGAIEQVKRGGGSSPSVWRILNHDPDWEEVSRIRAASVGGPYKGLDARIKAIEDNLDGLNVSQALAELSTEIAALRQRIVDGG